MSAKPAKEITARKFKSSVTEIWYPKPQHLIGAIEELKIRAGKLHTVITYARSQAPIFNRWKDVQWPEHCKRWALIWVRRYSKAEYKIGLQIFNQVCDRYPPTRKPHFTQ